VVVSADGAHGFSVTYEEHQQKVQQAKTEGIIP
jgi:cell division protein YceG involved in septum cleavage